MKSSDCFSFTLEWRTYISKSQTILEDMGQSISPKILKPSYCFHENFLYRFWYRSLRCAMKICPVFVLTLLCLLAKY